jgi:Mn2+/Fe2+ NRAMP family transporter
MDGAGHIPMMFALSIFRRSSAKWLGEGYFAVLRKNYSRKVLYPTLIGVLIGNTIEAAADLGGIAAAINLFFTVPIMILVPILGAGLFCLEAWGAYTAMRNIFRVLALALLAYTPADILARPDWGPVLKGTLVPTIHFDRDFLTMVVSVIGTTLSAYLYTWQSNEEVEEEKEAGRVLLSQRIGRQRRNCSTPDEMSSSGCCFRV